MTPEQPTKTIATTLDEPDYRAFGVIAAQRGISRAELARRLLVKETKKAVKPKA